MWKNSQELIKTIQKEMWAKEFPPREDFWNHMMEWVEEHILPEFLTEITRQVDEIIKINPDLSEQEILTITTRYIVNFLQASSASVRIYDPHTEQMLSYGSYPSEEESRETFIPLEKSIAGEVVKTQQTYLVPNIIREELYQDKSVTESRGIYSMMAVPLAIPHFFPHERDTVGVVQIYYPEKDRTFTKLEIRVAEVMARRLSFVIARKKILSMHRANEKKETIVRNVFLTLGSRGGVKLKEAFNRVIPELADMVNLQSSALFSVTKDLKSVNLEAGYPEVGGYHTIGKKLTVSSEPAFELLLNLRDYQKETAYEIVTSSYILIVEPQKSNLISENLKKFTAEHNINSILYVPLNVDGEISHFMTFDALDQIKRYKGDEIDIFLFLGRELIKAQKMERLDDALHDFKNPAIATAGFARRLKKLLESEVFEESKEQIKKYADILFHETSRLQELGMSIYQVGEEQAVNLTEILKRRFEINKEAIKALSK